jgi:hypothetical protein
LIALDQSGSDTYSLISVHRKWRGFGFRFNSPP